MVQGWVGQLPFLRSRQANQGVGGMARYCLRNFGVKREGPIRGGQFIIGHGLHGIAQVVDNISTAHNKDAFIPQRGQSLPDG